MTMTLLPRRPSKPLDSVRSPTALRAIQFVQLVTNRTTVRESQPALPVIRNRIVASLLVCVAICGCNFGDPGYYYEPITGDDGATGAWFKRIDGVSFSAGDMQILADEGSALYGIRVVNKSEKEVVVLGGNLATNGRTMNIDDSGNPPESIAPGASDTVRLLCDFPNPSSASAILGDRITWTLHVRIGNYERSVSVPLKRTRG
jgi:hypothetical protein